MRHGANLALALVLGVAGAAIVATPAAAQIAAALGKPLPSPDLPVGTVSVRVVAGSAASPVVGTNVTLIVNGAPRVARTDSAGRATFPGLPAGATVIAKVLDADKAEHASEEFALPESGGTRVMITTKPLQTGAGGGAPFAEGGGGMPNPRSMSGEARPEQSDPSGTITVRVTYDDFKDTPEGIPVALVGYAADGSTTFAVVKSDNNGRAQFADLDRSSGTSYFAMALVPRNGAVDRLVSAPMVLESQVGVRVILSSEKRDSKAPPVDDLGKADPQTPTPAGKLRVSLESVGQTCAQVTLVDAETKKPIATARTESAPPDPSRVQGGAQFLPDAKLAPGTVDVVVTGGAGQAEGPLPGIEVRVIPANSSDPGAGLAATTGADGTVHMALKVTEPQKAVFTINGRPLASQPFELGKAGGKLVIRAQWEDVGRPQAMFEPQGSGRAVFAECEAQGQHYRSMPIQLLESAGSKVSIYVYPRVMLRFQIRGFVEDQLLAAQGRFEITNYSWAPYRAGPDGLVVPMPHGFKGGVVFDPDQQEVAVAAGEGFRIIRPIPPGGRTFHGGFSLPVEDGKVAWALDLPRGTFNSHVEIRETPGMKVHTPEGVHGESRTVPEGKYFIIDGITIKPNTSMVMSLEGLPSPPAWRTWVPRVVGVLVVGVMLAGIGFALRRRPGVAAAAGVVAHEARRQRLLDELVELERTGDNAKRRDQVLRELEELWT